MESEFPSFSLTPNKVKDMSEEELDKSVEDQKVSIQAGQHNLNFVPGKHGFNRAINITGFLAIYLGAVNT